MRFLANENYPVKSIMITKVNLDHLKFVKPNLDILFVALNPPTSSNDIRHYFACNAIFWEQLYKAGLIIKEVKSKNADDLIFGSTKFNYKNWSYGITDLVYDVVENKSENVTVEDRHKFELTRLIEKNMPKIVILMHSKTSEKMLKYLGQKYKGSNSGYIGRIISDCPTIFYCIAFPSNQNESRPQLNKDARINRLKEVKDFLEQQKSTHRISKL